MEEMRRLIRSATELIARGHRQSNELQQLIDESKARLRESEDWLHDGPAHSTEANGN